MTRSRIPHHSSAPTTLRPATTPAGVLVVEDELIVAEDVQSRLKQLGYKVIAVVSSGEAAVERIASNRPDLVLMDIRLAGEMDGIEAAEIVRTRFDLPVVYLTAHADDRTLELAKQTDPFGYLLKPFDDRELHTTIEMALYKHRTGKNLRESESRFRKIAETAAAAIFIFREDRIVYANSFALELTGYTQEELFARKFWEFVYPDFQAFVRDLAPGNKPEGGADRRYEIKIRRKDGEERWLDFSSGAILNDGQPATLVTALDITRRMRAEEERNVFQAQLLQRQKMESIGNLVVGLAHNFNNILAIIRGYASRLDRAAVDPVRITQSVEAIQKAVQRGAGLIDQLIGVTRKTNLLISPVNLNSLTDEITGAVRKQLPPTIHVTQRLDPGLPLIPADPNQILQALMNICLNGVEAMPLGGTLAIATETIPGPALRERFPDTRSSRYARVIVTDTGKGIGPETKGRIFEPFFTTKDRALHPGLGLPMVYGIVASHQGFIDVITGMGGTEIDLYFPTDSSPEEQAPDKRKRTEIESRSDRQSILVVEPGEMIRKLAVDALKLAGYTVVSAANPDEALSALSVPPGAKVDLVLLDMGLTEGPGSRTFEMLKTINPALRVVFSTGDERKNLKEDLLKRGADGVIRKPYTAPRILEVIEDVLEGKPPELCIRD